MNYVKLLEQIENIAEEERFYGEMTTDLLEDIFDTFAKFNCVITYAEQICYFYSDQDGAEVDDEMFEQVMEAIEEQQ